MLVKKSQAAGATVIVSSLLYDCVGCIIVLLNPYSEPRVGRFSVRLESKSRSFRNGMTLSTSTQRASSGLVPRLAPPSPICEQMCLRTKLFTIP
jgi:hypothetical protein